jgi:hypothetical protein
MRPALRRTVLLVLAAAAACAPAPPGSAAGADEVREADAEWQRLAARLTADDPVERFIQATSLFRGVPYHNGPLGEGDAGGPDPDPRCDFERADCVTFLEQSLALAVADPADPASFPAVLDAIRYRDGRVSYVTRNHYMVRDWIPANAWLLDDVTAEVGGEHVERVERTIDRASFLRDNGAEPRDGVDDARVMEVHFVPSSALAAVAPALKSGDLIFFLGKANGIFVVHTGLVVRHADGGLTLRHGSSRAGKVQDESFAKYSAHSRSTQGFLVLRIRPDAAPPARG